MSRCEGCDRPLGVIEALRWQVCLDCTRRRARAVATHRCGCRTDRYAVPKQAGQRRWLSCRRCLGTVRALEDEVRQGSRGRRSSSAQVG